MSVCFQTSRLRLSEFAMRDADELFDCITPAVARFMPWEPPASRAEYRAHCEARLKSQNRFEFSFVIRRNDTLECLGLAALESADGPAPELGIWLKEAAHRNGYGGEAVRALAEWASASFASEKFLYPVAAENSASRRIAERLGGSVVAQGRNAKYEKVTYEIPAEGIR